MLALAWIVGGFGHPRLNNPAKNGDTLAGLLRLSCDFRSLTLSTVAFWATHICRIRQARKLALLLVENSFCEQGNSKREAIRSANRPSSGQSIRADISLCSRLCDFISSAASSWDPCAWPGAPEDDSQLKDTSSKCTRDADERKRIALVNAVEQMRETRQQTDERHRHQSADAQSGTGHFHAWPTIIPNTLLRSAPMSHADSDLLGSAHDRVGHHSVDADRRQE